MGADWPLVQDALVIAGIALASGAALTFGILRLRRGRNNGSPNSEKSNSLEDRVRVLERIATDRSVDLAAQIEGLRTSGEKN